MLIAASDEVREARIRRGLSLAEVGAALGWSKSKVWRVEHGDPCTTVIDLGRVCAVVGLDPSVRVYPSDEGIRDAGQIALLQRLRTRLHPSWSWSTEVPVGQDRDRRAWDAVIRRERVRIGVEAESRLRDAQALSRRLALKHRDGYVDHVVLLLAETRANTAGLAGAREYLRVLLPLDTRQVMGALVAGRDPGASGIVVL